MLTKAKIGREVKGIPRIWTKRQKITEEDDDTTRAYKERMNYLCLDRHPYFFVYRYEDTRRKYNQHVKKYEKWAKQSFVKPLDTILTNGPENEAEQEFLAGFFRYSPVIDSNSVVNRLCHHIEKVNFNVRSHLKMKESTSVYKFFISDEIEFNCSTYDRVVEAYEKFCKECANYKYTELDSNSQDPLMGNFVGMLYSYVSDACSNVYEAISYLAYYLYEVKEKANKEMLWKTYGQEICTILRRNNDGTVMIPMYDEDGDIEYLGKTYSMKEVAID